MTAHMAVEGGSATATWPLDRAPAMRTIHELRGSANLFRLTAQLLRRELTAEQARALEARGVLALLFERGYDLEADKVTDESFLAGLRREYARIFIGPGPHVHPYGSVHHPDDPKKGRLWGDTTVWVRRFAIEHGLEFGSRGYDGIPDHVGHELEIYALLLEAELRALEDADSAKVDRLQSSERLFLHAQLLRWVPRFCAAVMNRASQPFYRELARLVTDLLDIERDRLAEDAAVGTASPAGGVADPQMS